LFFFLKEKDQQQRDENLKKAKEIIITEDSSLPKAKVVCLISCLKWKYSPNNFLVEN
jgi:hypothetical protein